MSDPVKLWEWDGDGMETVVLTVRRGEIRRLMQAQSLNGGVTPDHAVPELRGDSRDYLLDHVVEEVVAGLRAVLESDKAAATFDYELDPFADPWNPTS